VVGVPQCAEKLSFLGPIFQPPCGIDPGVEDFAAFGPVALDTQVTMDGPDQFPDGFPQLAITAGGQDLEDVGAVEVEAGVAFEAVVSVFLGEVVVETGEALEGVVCRGMVFPGVGVDEGVFELVAVAGAGEEAVAGQFVEGAFEGLGLDLKGGGQGVGSEGREGEDAGDGEDVPGGLAHLVEAAFQQQGDAVAFALSLVEGVQGGGFEPLKVVGGGVAGFVEVAADEADGQGQAAEDVADAADGGSVPGLIAAPGFEQVGGFVVGQGVDFQAVRSGVVAVAGGDDDGAFADNGKDGGQIIGVFGAVQKNEGLAAGKRAKGGLPQRGVGRLAEGPGDGLQCAKGFGGVVEFVPDHAVGELGGRFGSVGGQSVKGFGGDGAFADAAGAPEGDDVAGAEGGHEGFDFLAAAGEVVGAAGELAREPRGLPVDMDAAFDVGIVAHNAGGGIVDFGHAV